MPPFETVNCGCAPEPCQPPPHHPQTGQNWLSDNLLMCLLALAVVLFCFYFVIKAGVKGGILELLNDPNFSLSKLLGGGECR
ncbi:MAG: hypothetical protein Q4D08_06345 [Clostridia bacterium]|nr:hypothetical protein [Clostridia bacterium]